MSKKIIKNIPNLRFPEFVNELEWKKVKLSKLGKLVSGLTYSPDDVRENGLLVLRSSNVQDGEISLEDNVYVRTDIKGANLSEPNDILICVRNGSKALIGKNALIPDNMPLCTHGAFMTTFRAESPKFVFQLFQTKDYQKQVNADLGATINSINGNKFIKYEFNVPSTEKEQTKIADCLSSLDSLIIAQSQKVEFLKEHKKGLLQNLFPKDGESVPKYRFSEFIHDGDWEEKPLKKVCNITNGKSNAQDHDENGIYPLFDRSEVIKKSNNFLFDCEAVIIPGEGVRFVPKYYKGKFDLHQRAYALQNFKENGKFVYHFMDFTKDILASQAVLSTVLSLRLPILENFTIKLPKPKEQQKIADCLTSIDDEINIQIQKIESLKEHKKGLLQQLFPSNEVING